MKFADQELAIFANVRFENGAKSGDDLLVGSRVMNSNFNFATLVLKNGDLIIAWCTVDYYI